MGGLIVVIAAVVEMVMVVTICHVVADCCIAMVMVVLAIDVVCK